MIVTPTWSACTLGMLLDLTLTPSALCAEAAMAMAFTGLVMCSGDRTIRLARVRCGDVVALVVHFGGGVRLHGATEQVNQHSCRR